MYLCPNMTPMLNEGFGSQKGGTILSWQSKAEGFRVKIKRVFSVKSCATVSNTDHIFSQFSYFATDFETYLLLFGVYNRDEI